MVRNAIHIGTSGWHYQSWRGPFFPKRLMIKHQLRYYSTQFDTTELNGVFYRTPTLDAVRNWSEQTPDNFLFSWKASKFITHWKRLNPNSKSSITLMETRLRCLGRKVGPVLFQLPPSMRVNRERLASFLKLLSKRRRYAFEFRHPSWYDDDVFELLHRHGIALCISDHHDAPSPWIATAEHVYLRGHGPTGRYKGHYSKQTLARWAGEIDKWRRSRRDVFVYFDNDQKSAAPADAAMLRDMIG